MSKEATVRADINRMKKALINKAAKKGLYENFGQKEVRKLEDKHIDSSCYTDEMNTIREMVRSFDNFCLSYSPYQ